MKIFDSNLDKTIHSQIQIVVMSEDRGTVRSWITNTKIRL